MKKRLATLSLALCCAGLFVPDPVDAQAPPHAQGRPEGALTGAHIYLSAGHGWHPTPRSWSLQRGNNHGVVEDLSNAETVNQYLVPLLENAGAQVHTTRERCFNEQMVIVEAEETDLGPLWEREEAHGAREGAHFVAPAGVPGGYATFTPTIPADGRYAVYAWYRPPVDLPPAQRALFTINHSGGTTTVEQDLAHDGYTWRYIGTYWFEEGTDAESASVTISGTPLDRGRYLVADAIRFGGGMGDFPHPDTGETSGRPRWEESGLTYAQFMGLDPERDTRRFNQVWAMPLLAEWLAEPRQKGRSIYVSWHTNGSMDGQKSGISTYIYSRHAWGPPREFEGHPGGDRLAYYLHNTVRDHVRAAWDPDWNDVGIITRWLGETNPLINAKMPAVLLENGYHDNSHDASYILDPQFRALSARAAYHGILEYFANEVDGFDNATRLPEPPTHLRIRSVDNNEVEIAWEPGPARDADSTLGDPATSYRLYRSPNGKGFDDGTPAEGTRVVLPDLQPGTVTFFRVTGVNDGGESLPTETLAVSLAVDDAQPRVLLVNAFDRLDRALNLRDSETMPRTTFERGMLDRMNSFDYVIQNGGALHAAGFAFDSASNEAIRDELIDLADYRTVIWAAGRELEPPSERERATLRTHVANGGSLVVSGEEIAQALQESDPGFLRDLFGATVSQTGPATTQTVTLASRFAERIDIEQPIAFGDDRAVYLVSQASVLLPDGGEPLAHFVGTDHTGVRHAAIGKSHGDGRAILTSVPLETLPDDARSHVVAGMLEWLRR